MAAIKFILYIIVVIGSFNLVESQKITDTKNVSIIFHSVSDDELPPRVEAPAVLSNETDNFEESGRKPVISSEGNGNRLDHIDETKPRSCSDINSSKQTHQPIQTADSVLKKCCPMGESLHQYDGPGGKRCNYENKPFEPTLISAVLYDNCIEHLRQPYVLEVEVGNPCNESFIYTAEDGDKLYVMQNGSLLMMDEHGKKAFDVADDYCMDVDFETGELMAFVCATPIDAHISKAPTILFAIFMLISVICSIIVAAIHFAIREFRTVHGLALGCMSSWLALGFFIYIYSQLYHGDRGKIGYFVQFCLLSYFCWLVMLGLNIFVTSWYFLPQRIAMTRAIRYSRLSLYGIITFAVPLALVIMTYNKGLNGMPSYFYQAWSDSVLESQRYFIPPVSICLLLTLCLLLGSYFGFRRCKDRRVDYAFFTETKHDAICIAILLAIISITWTLEVITFYMPAGADYMAFMDIMNGMQGFFILMIFVVERDRRTTIVEFCHGRQKPVRVPTVEETELKEINSKS